MEHPDPDLLALAALPAEQPDPAVDAHLARCPLCRSHVDSLRRTVDLALNSGDTLGGADAPPDHVWQAISAEITDAQTVRAARSRRPVWRRLAVPVAAAVIGVAVGIGIGAGTASVPSTPTVVAQLAPVTAADPSGHGTVGMVTAGGRRDMVIQIAGVTNMAGADFLEAWLMDPTGSKLVSLGSLAQEGATFRGTFTVPANLPMAEFDTIDISAEKWDGNPDHSRISLLRGTVA